MHLRLLNDQMYFNSHRQLIRKMVRSFLKKSRLPDKYFKYHICMVENGLTNKNGLMSWIVEDLTGPIGYAVTLLTRDQFDRPVMVVLQLHTESARHYLEELVQYARDAKIYRVIFQTLRKRKVVEKWLGKGWNTGPTIFEKVV